jgi:ADP-heptose:LPS heptosyltransferase
VPALRGLRKALPDARLMLAGHGEPAALLRHAGLVDDVLPLRDLNADPPGAGLGRHMAVNLHGRGPQSHRLLLGGEPTDLLAFACPAAGWSAGPPWLLPALPQEHDVARWCRLLETAGIPCDAADLSLPVLAAVAGPTNDTAVPGVTVIHPGASSAARRWPVGRWAAVAAALGKGGHRVVVTGSAAERDLGAAVCRDIPPGIVTDATGTTDLLAVAALVRDARLVLSGDTGVAHLASAFAVPSVVLFGPTPPARWGPPTGPHRVLWHGDLLGHPGGDDPHADRPNPALLAITVGEVLTAVDEVLAYGAGHSLPQAPP